jgi:hypothetical protein
VSRLRAGDHSLGRLHIERERQESEKRAERKKEWEKTRRLEATIAIRCDVIERVYKQKKKEGSLSPEEETEYQERLEKVAEWREYLKQAEADDKHMWAEFVV